jgi:hypothetical protein
MSLLLRIRIIEKGRSVRCHPYLHPVLNIVQTLAPALCYTSIVRQELDSLGKLQNSILNRPQFVRGLMPRY